MFELGSATCVDCKEIYKQSDQKRDFAIPESDAERGPANRQYSNVECLGQADYIQATCPRYSTLEGRHF
jgi:translation elongation factor EF-Tu-like GTPase